MLPKPKSRFTTLLKILQHLKMLRCYIFLVSRNVNGQHFFLVIGLMGALLRLNTLCSNVKSACTLALPYYPFKPKCICVSAL